MVVISGNGHKLGQALAKPHCDVSFHVDGEWLKAFLEAADGEVAQTANILTKVNTPNLRKTQSADWNKA